MKKKNFIPMTNCSQIDKFEVKNKMCEYFYCSSYNSLLVGNQKRDYLSLDMLLKVLNTGARYIEFEINQSNRSDMPFPMIGTGELEGNWSYSLNNISFDNVMKFIKTHAFVKNINYPLIIYLKFNSLNKHLIDYVGDKILCILGQVIVDNTKYNKQFVNIAQENMCSLNKKIIFFSSLDEENYKNTKFEDVVISNNSVLLNRMYYKDLEKYIPDKNNSDAILDTLDENTQHIEEENFKLFLKKNIVNTSNIPKTLLDMLLEEKNKGNLKYPLRHFNKFGLTIVLPHKKNDIWTLNYDYREYMANGCQFIAMNFQEEPIKGMFISKNNPKNNHIQDYLVNFESIPIYLKDSYLRYIPEKQVKDNYLTQYFESQPFIPDLYKIDYDKKASNKIFRLKNNVDSYLNIGNYKDVKFKNLISNKKYDFNFMIFGNLNIPQSIMFSPINTIVPINYKNRKFLNFKRGSTKSDVNFSCQEVFIDYDKSITSKEKEKNIDSIINSSFYAIKPKKKSQIDKTISFCNIDDNKDNTEFFYNNPEEIRDEDKNKLTLFPDSTREDEQENMCFTIEEVPNLKTYIYIRIKFLDSSYYYLKLKKNNEVVFERINLTKKQLKMKEEVYSKLKEDDNFRFQVIPSIGNKSIFNKENFYLKANNNKLLKYKCDTLKAVVNSRYVSKAAVLKINIKKNTEVISIYNKLSGLYDRYLGINSNIYMIDEFDSSKLKILKPLFVSEYLVLKERKYDENCTDTLIKTTEKLDKTTKIKTNYYMLETLLEYK